MPIRTGSGAVHSPSGRTVPLIAGNATLVWPIFLRNRRIAAKELRPATIGHQVTCGGTCWGGALAATETPQRGLTC